MNHTGELRRVLTGAAEISWSVKNKNDSLYHDGYRDPDCLVLCDGLYVLYDGLYYEYRDYRDGSRNGDTDPDCLVLSTYFADSGVELLVNPLEESKSLRTNAFLQAHRGSTLDDFLRMLLNPNSDFCVLLYSKNPRAWFEGRPAFDDSPARILSDEEVAFAWLAQIIDVVRALSYSDTLSYFYNGKVVLACLQDPVVRRALHAVNRSLWTQGKDFDFELHMMKLVAYSINPECSESDFELACAPIMCVRGLSALSVDLRYKIASFLDCSFPLRYLGDSDLQNANGRHARRVLIDVLRGVIGVTSLNEGAHLLCDFSLDRHRWSGVSQAALLQMVCEPSEVAKDDWTWRQRSEHFFLGVTRKLYGFSVQEYPHEHSLVQGLLEKYRAVASLFLDQCREYYPVFTNSSLEKILALIEHYKECLRALKQDVSFDKIAAFGMFLTADLVAPHVIYEVFRIWSADFTREIQMQVFGQFFLKSYLKRHFPALSYSAYSSPEKLKQLFSLDLDAISDILRKDHERCRVKEAIKTFEVFKTMF